MYQIIIERIPGDREGYKPKKIPGKPEMYKS